MKNPKEPANRLVAQAGPPGEQDQEFNYPSLKYYFKISKSKNSEKIRNSGICNCLTCRDSQYKESTIWLPLKVSSDNLLEFHIAQSLSKQTS